MEGMLGPLCLCCGPLGSLEVRMGVGNAELKLVHAIAGDSSGSPGAYSPENG